jgi:hypothetical protein
MSHKSFSYRRVARWLAWTAGAQLLSVGPAVPAPPADPAASQPATRIAQASSDQTTHRQPVRDVSDALGQRLDRMMLDSQSVQPR